MYIDFRFPTSWKYGIGNRIFGEANSVWSNDETIIRLLRVRACALSFPLSFLVKPGLPDYVLNSLPIIDAALWRLVGKAQASILKWRSSWNKWSKWIRSLHHHEVGFFKRKLESKKTRKQELDQESDQGKKKVFSFFWSSSCFLVFLIAFLVKFLFSFLFFLFSWSSSCFLL